MSLSASQYDKVVQFRRRVAGPDEPAASGPTLRGGFADYGPLTWANFREGRPRPGRVAGFEVGLRGGTLTVRQGSTTATTNDQVVIEGIAFLIDSVMASNGDLLMEVTEAIDADSYGRMAEQKGEVVVLRRPGTPSVEAVTRAIVTGYAPEELVSGVNQGLTKVIAMHQDLVDQGFPVPPIHGDWVIIRGSRRFVENVDPNTHRFAGEIAAYELRTVART
jgi:hypothetical protein